MGLSVITLMIIGWGYLLSNPESTEFNDLAALLKGLFLIAIGLTYFVGYLVQSTELKITRESLFWVTIGFIVFEAGSFFQTAFLNAFILQDLQIGKRILGDINVFNCLLHGFILIGILVGILRARENKNTTSNLSL